MNWKIIYVISFESLCNRKVRKSISAYLYSKSYDELLIGRSKNGAQAIQTIQYGPSKELQEKSGDTDKRCYFQVFTGCLSFVLLKLRWGAKGIKIPIYLIAHAVGGDGSGL